MGTGSAPGAAGEGFLFPALPPDPEVNPDASEFVPTLLPRSDNEDSSEIEENHIILNMSGDIRNS